MMRDVKNRTNKFRDVLIIKYSKFEIIMETEVQGQVISALF
jgi:hypothetical protein